MQFKLSYYETSRYKL